MQENIIAFELTEEERMTVLSAITTLENVLGSKLITLTSEAKHSNLRLGDKSVAFVEKACEIAKLDPNIVDSFVSVPEFVTDLESLRMFRTINLRLSKIVSNLNDSESQAGHEAYQAALQTYALMKNAAKMGHPGAKTAVEELKQRFPRTRKKTEVEKAN